MCHLSVCSLILVFTASCYVSGSTKAITTTTTATNTSNDDAFLQAMNLANSRNNSPKPYTPIQEQQKQQQQHEQHAQHHRQHPKKGSLLGSEAAAVGTATMRTRQKRSQHGLVNPEDYLKNMPTYVYNLALFNIMHRLRTQLSNIELARVRSRLGRTAVADLQLFNEIYNNNNNNNKATQYNDETATMNVGELGNSNSDSVNDGVAGLIATDTGHGAVGMLGGIEDEGSVAIGAGNDMFANDIEDLSVPWQFVGRVSKKSSALYKPRLGKRVQHLEQQQQQQPITCN